VSKAKRVIRQQMSAIRKKKKKRLKS